MAKRTAKRTAKFGSTIPELKTIINKFGCGLADSPPYVVVGQYDSQVCGPIGGILGAAMNEFYAHQLCREVNKSGSATVKRTEFHPRPEFSIAIYNDNIRKRVEINQQAALEAERIAQHPAPRIISWGGKKDN